MKPLPTDLAVVLSRFASNKGSLSATAIEASKGDSSRKAGKYFDCCDAVPQWVNALATPMGAHVATAIPISP